MNIMEISSFSHKLFGSISSKKRDRQAQREDKVAIQNVTEVCRSHVCNTLWLDSRYRCLGVGWIEREPFPYGQGVQDVSVDWHSHDLEHAPETCWCQVL